MKIKFFDSKNKLLFADNATRVFTLTCSFNKEIYVEVSKMFHQHHLIYANECMGSVREISPTYVCRK